MEYATARNLTLYIFASKLHLMTRLVGKLPVTVNAFGRPFHEYFVHFFCDESNDFCIIPQFIIQGAFA